MVSAFLAWGSAPSSPFSISSKPCCCNSFHLIWVCHHLFLTPDTNSVTPSLRLKPAAFPKQADFCLRSRTAAPRYRSQKQCRELLWEMLQQSIRKSPDKVVQPGFRLHLDLEILVCSPMRTEYLQMQTSPWQCTNMHWSNWYFTEEC